MADRVIFMGWNRPVAGREKQAMQLFQKSLEFWNRLQKEGKIESFEPVQLAFHGGDLNGFLLIKCSAQKIMEIQGDSEFIDMVVEAGYCLEGYGHIVGYVGEGLTGIFSRWAKFISG